MVPKVRSFSMNITLKTRSTSSVNCIYFIHIILKALTTKNYPLANFFNCCSSPLKRFPSPGLGVALSEYCQIV